MQKIIMISGNNSLEEINKYLEDEDTDWFISEISRPNNNGEWLVVLDDDDNYEEEEEEDFDDDEEEY